MRGVEEKGEGKNGGRGTAIQFIDRCLSPSPSSNNCYSAHPLLLSSPRLAATRASRLTRSLAAPFWSWSGGNPRLSISAKKQLSTGRSRGLASET